MTCENLPLLIATLALLLEGQPVWAVSQGRLSSPRSGLGVPGSRWQRQDGRGTDRAPSTGPDTLPPSSQQPSGFHDTALSCHFLMEQLGHPGSCGEGQDEPATCLPSAPMSPHVSQAAPSFGFYDRNRPEQVALEALSLWTFPCHFPSVPPEGGLPFSME